MATQDANEQWGILEIMGHRKAAGLVREVTRFGAQMAQVDIPEVPAVDEKWSAPEGTPGRYQIRDAQPAIPAHTQLYGGHSIFCFTPTSEAVAREAAARFRQAPPKVLDIAPRSRLLGSAESDGMQDAEVLDDEPPVGRMHSPTEDDEDGDDADNQVPGR